MPCAPTREPVPLRAKRPILPPDAPKACLAIWARAFPPSGKPPAGMRLVPFTPVQAHERLLSSLSCRGLAFLRMPARGTRHLSPCELPAGGALRGRSSLRQPIEHCPVPAQDLVRCSVPFFMSGPRSASSMLLMLSCLGFKPLTLPGSLLRDRVWDFSSHGRLQRRSYLTSPCLQMPVHSPGLCKGEPRQVRRAPGGHSDAA